MKINNYTPEELKVLREALTELKSSYMAYPKYVPPKMYESPAGLDWERKIKAINRLLEKIND